MAVPDDMHCLLAVNDLQIDLPAEGRNRLPVVDRVSFEINVNETLGIVGESGSGKSMLCRSLIGTLHRHGGARVAGGSIRFRGQELAGASQLTWRTIRGQEIAYVPQSSLAGLNPVVSVGHQLRSVLSLESKEDPRIRSSSVRDRAVELLELVGITRPQEVLKQRPHELSGGMRQRVMIAGALARSPSLLIADEPTTALDVRVQRRILDLLQELQSRLKMAMIFVSHDLAVVDSLADRTLVMYAGAAMEIGESSAVASTPLHPYSRGLRSASILDRSSPLAVIPGDAPPVGSWPLGCRFWPRCSLRSTLASDEACRSGTQPALRKVAGRETACLFAEHMLAPSPLPASAETV